MYSEIDLQASAQCRALQVIEKQFAIANQLNEPSEKPTHMYVYSRTCVFRRVVMTFDTMKFILTVNCLIAAALYFAAALAELAPHVKFI